MLSVTLSRQRSSGAGQSVHSITGAPPCRSRCGDLSLFNLHCWCAPQRSWQAQRHVLSLRQRRVLRDWSQIAAQTAKKQAMRDKAQEADANRRLTGAWHAWRDQWTAKRCCFDTLLRLLSQQLRCSEWKDRCVRVRQLVVRRRQRSAVQQWRDRSHSSQHARGIARLGAELQQVAMSISAAAFMRFH